MLQREKKAKRIIINASNTKKINKNFNKNSINNNIQIQIPNKNPSANTRLSLSQQQMETSSYRLSLVRNNAIINRFVETEIKESFCSTFFRENPEMLDTRPPSEKLLEYYGKLGIYYDINNKNSIQASQKNGKIKVNSNDVVKFNNDVKYSHSDNFSYISYPLDLQSSFTRKDKIKLLSQMIPLEIIVHGENSFELLRAHIMIAHIYNRTHKPHPAIRHLNEAQKIQRKMTNTSKRSPISKSSRASRKASPSSIISQKRSMYKKQEFSQASVKTENYIQNEGIGKEIDDELSIEFSNAYLILAIDKSTQASIKLKYLKNAIVNLSRFTDESQNLNDHLIFLKNLAQARFLFAQKNFEESAKYYENVLTSMQNSIIINEKESKSSKSDKKSSYNDQISNNKKSENEAVKLDELEELADIKMEAAENIQMIIKNQFNIIKEKARKIRSSRNTNDVNYENLIDDIDYALDLYYEARDSYEDVGLDDNVEECDDLIQKLEKKKNEVHIFIEQEEQHQIEIEQQQIEQKEEEEEEILEDKENKNQIENKNILKIENKKKKLIVENTVEVNFESSGSLDEKEYQVDDILKEDTNKNAEVSNENKLNVDMIDPLLNLNQKKNASSTSFQRENEYGSDENEDETNIKKHDDETEFLNKNLDTINESKSNDKTYYENKIKPEEESHNDEVQMNSDFERVLASSISDNKNEEKEGTENGLKNTIDDISNLLLNEDKISNDDIKENSSYKPIESLQMNEITNDDDSFDSDDT